MEEKPSCRQLEQRVEELERECRDLQQANTALETLLNTTTESAFLGDLHDGRVLACNKKAAERVQRDVKELVGLTMFDYLPAELAATRKAQGDAVVRAGRAVRFQDQREGRVYDNSITPVFDEEGTIYALAIHARDITDILHLEKSLVESEERFRILTEQSPSMIFINTAGRVAYVNPRCEEIMGYGRDEFYAPSFDFRTLIAPGSMKTVERAFVEHGRGKEVAPYECGLLTKEGRRIDVILSTKLIHFGEQKSILGIMTDITELKRTEEELRKTRDRLEERVKERTAELLKANALLKEEAEKRDRAKEKLSRYHGRLRSLASQLSLAEEKERRRIATEVHDHIAQTLAFAKIKLGELQKTAPADADGIAAQVSQLIDTAIQDTRALISELGNPVLYELGLVPAIDWLARKIEKEHGFQVTFQDDGRQKPVSEDVKVFLFRALRELLANVAKHAKATHCSVSLRAQEGQLRMDVVDDGIGFDAEGLTSAGGHGNGFGFFSIRERLEPLGGSMGVWSKKNEGTRVTLTAPLSSPEA